MHSYSYSAGRKSCILTDYAIARTNDLRLHTAVPDNAAPSVAYRVGFDKIGPFFWHFMLLALPFFWPNYANFYALLAEKCS